MRLEVQFMAKNSVSWIPSTKTAALRWLRASSLVLFAALSSAGPLLAQGFDETKTPARPVNLPASWNGVLKPIAIVQDQTSFRFQSNLTASNTFATDVDVENGWVFVSTGRGLILYDGRTTPEAPVKKPTFFASTANVPDWNQSDLKHYTFGLDAPAGYDGVVALTSIASNGMLIFDTRDKEHAPLLKYQDGGKSGTQVWSTTIGNTHYGFFAAPDQKILMYNLSAAQALVAPCLDISPTSIPCQDGQGRKVYAGKINTQFGVNFVHGAGEYVVASQGSQGVEIWRVSDPTSPQRVLKFAPPGSTYGVAMWQEGTKYYLATVEIANVPPRNLRIYDVSCITSNSCGSSMSPVGTFGMNHAVLSAITFVTFSRSGTTPFLYLGSEDQFNGGPQREYLLDVSVPSAPVEVTPAQSSIPGGWGYWGWYYAGNSTGFNWVMPRGAKFLGSYLYRAAFSVLDVHKYSGNLAPTAGFSYTTPAATDGRIYIGDQVNFLDQSTGNPTSWSWSFTDGVPGVSSLKNPSVSFTAPAGRKSVSLTINGVGDTRTDTVTVVDPAPVVSGITLVPAAPKVCQRINFSGVGVDGKPTLGYSWQILNSDANPLIPAAGGTGTTFDWDTADRLAQSYLVRLTLTGPGGTVNRDVPFTLSNVGSLPLQGAFTPIAPPNPTGATVSFSLPASAELANASEWSWDFGDGQGWTAWSSDPSTGPSPTHTYAALGTYNVKVRVKNCLGPVEGIESSAVAVPITQLISLIAKFQPVCFGGLCIFSTVDPIAFIDQSSGATKWDYDWNNDGTFEDADHTTPVGSHTYTTTGSFRPKLRVWSGTSSAIYQVPVEQTLTIQQSTGGGGGGGNPSISISGASTATIGTNVTLTASASRCTASSSGWTWSTDGATGTSTSSSITLSWSSTGPKNVTVRNSGCGSTQGARTVTVSNGGGGGGGALKAAFTYAPVPVLQNQAVAFDGSTSTGSPTSYVWDFGDGSPTATGSSKVNHTFTQKGTFTVKLSVAAAGSCPPAPFCENETQQAVVVTSNTPIVSASFNSEICVTELSFVFCNAATGQEVTFVDASLGNIVSRTWDFGDGETGSGASVKHTYKKAGTYPLTLTVSDGTTTNSLSRNIVVTGGPATEAMVLPWIAKTVDGALVQSSDFYLHNPGAESIDVTLEFRQRGLPEATPPKVTRTIAPYATLFASDVVKNLFGRENISGFVAVKVDRGSVQPVVMSFNTTFRGDGSEFGQTVPGYLVSNTGAASTTGNTQIQHLVGLSDNTDRFAYFGLSNPGGEPVTYRLRFFDNLGREIGTPSQATILPRNGSKQYQVKDVHTLFGISDKDDYRVMVESDKGSPIFPYGANLRRASNDPSFVAVGGGASRVFLLGALSTPGANNSVWQSDVVLANTSTGVALVDLTFNNVGLTSTPTDTIHETLQPGETRRLADVIGTKWNIRNGVGVLTLDSDAPGDVFPLVQGESYENTNPAKRYGQTLPALTDKQAAGANQGQYLVGLRQDTKYRTTFWVFNPGPDNGEYDIIFRALDGRELSRVRNVNIASGKLRQFNQAQFPSTGLESGFTVQVVVKNGKVLTAAQVVNNATNDPAYIQGETR
jgi:PKD repeat protein